MITYIDLLHGYILQVGDIIDNCHGVKRLEVRYCTDGYYLYDPEHLNKFIYKVVEIEPMGKGSGGFPELESRIALTKEVIRIFQASPFKVGDQVQIKKRVKDESDYPFGFTDTMAALEGKIFTIRDIGRIDSSSDSDLDKCEGDPHWYHFEGIGYNWHSSMFERVPDSHEASLLEEIPPKETTQENTPIHINVKSSTIKIVL